MPPPVTVVGNPGPIGGAPVEIWATMRLWADHGVQVSCMPTSPLQDGWQERMEGKGIKVLPVGTNDHAIAQRITDPIAVAFCNGHFITASPGIRAKLVWVGCQTHAFPSEAKVPPFDAYVFQSRYQMDIMAESHKARGISDSRRHLIRGAFDTNEFWAHPRHRFPNEPFVIGRISRPHPFKYTVDIWDRFATIRSLVPGPLHFRVMGWTRHGTHRYTGKPPDWVECMGPGVEPVQQFLAKCHVLCQFGDANENWPRVGLEAMAAGVPLVVENKAGWREMVQHGKTGFLADDAGQMAAHIAVMAIQDTDRHEIAEAAQKRVKELADPSAIWAGWENLFEKMIQ